MQHLVNHLVNKELALEEKVKLEVDRYKSRLNLDDILRNPQAELVDFALSLVHEIFLKHATESVLIGVEFADSVKKQKEPMEIEDVDTSGDE